MQRNGAIRCQAQLRQMAELDNNLSGGAKVLQAEPAYWLVTVPPRAVQDRRLQLVRCCASASYHSTPILVGPYRIQSAKWRICVSGAGGLLDAKEGWVSSNSAINPNRVPARRWWCVTVSSDCANSFGPGPSETLACQSFDFSGWVSWINELSRRLDFEQWRLLSANTLDNRRNCRLSCS